MESAGDYFFLAGKTHNGAVQGIFRGGRDLFEPKIVLSVGLEMLILQFVIQSTPDLVESTWWPCWPPLAVGCGHQPVYLCVHKDLLQNAVVLAEAKMDSNRGFCLKYCAITESLVPFFPISPFMSVCPRKSRMVVAFCVETRKTN